MPNRTLTAAVAAVMLTAAGCSMMPEYSRPEAPLAAAWPGGMQGDADAADTAWQEFFKSDTLRALIERTLSSNRNLRAAVLNIEKARAAYRIQKADSLPTVTGSAGISQQRVAEDAGSTGSAYTSQMLMTADAGITAYELDFFGRIKSLNQKALETYLATEEAALNTRIVLIAETADAYLTLLADRKLLSLAESTFKAHKETYAVIQHQYKVGTASRLDLAQAATSVESARVSISQFTRQAAQAENAVTLLAGASVDDLLSAGETIDDIRFMDSLPAGLPSKVLLARPDIRRAEHLLKAANADIGAARAALYPAIRLTGSAGFASQSLSFLFESGNAFAWSFAPSLTIPIFNRGRLKASLDQAETGEKIAAAQYEGAVQAAFREVADQLAARRTYKNQMTAQKALVAETQKTYTLSRARYLNGIDNFLTVLDAQRSLFSAQQGAITVKQAYLSNLVNLYKVLGGGQV